MRTKKTLISLLFLLLSIVLTACGGGGGGSSGGVTPVAPTTPIAITTANADAVAYTAIDAFGPAGDGISLASVTSPTPASAATRIRLLDLVKLARDTYRDVSSSPSVPTAYTTQGCPGGGSATTPEDTDPLPVTMTFNNCSENGLTINGSMTVSGVGDMDMGPFNGAVTFNSLTISDGSDSFGINGTMNIKFTVSGTTETGTVTCSILQLTTSGETIDLTGMNISYIEKYSVSEQENVRYTVNSTLLKGSVQVTTTADLYYDLTYFYDYPYKGTMVITGANSKIILTALSNVPDNPGAVHIQVDEDNDGNFEENKFVSWNALASATLP